MHPERNATASTPQADLPDLPTPEPEEAAVRGGVLVHDVSITKFSDLDRPTQISMNYSKIGGE
jgi:hypothetical protein